MEIKPSPFKYSLVMIVLNAVEAMHTSPFRVLATVNATHPGMPNRFIFFDAYSDKTYKVQLIFYKKHRPLSFSY